MFGRTQLYLNHLNLLLWSYYLNTVGYLSSKITASIKFLLRYLQIGTCHTGFFVWSPLISCSTCRNYLTLMSHVLKRQFGNKKFMARFFFIALVRRSTNWYWEETWGKWMVPDITYWHIKWQSTSMCLVRSSKIGFAGTRVFWIRQGETTKKDSRFMENISRPNYYPICRRHGPALSFSRGYWYSGLLFTFPRCRRYTTIRPVSIIMGREM